MMVQFSIKIKNIVDLYNIFYLHERLEFNGVFRRNIFEINKGPVKVILNL